MSTTPTSPAPVTPTYNLQVSSGDLAAMLLQQQLDALDREIAECNAHIERVFDQLQALLDKKHQEAKDKYAKIAENVEALAAAFRPFYLDWTLFGGLDESSSDAREIFAPFTKTAYNYYTSGASPSIYFRKHPLGWSWAIGATRLDTDGDTLRSTLHSAHIFVPFTSDELSVVETLIADINTDGYAPRAALQAKRENAPELERQVRAKLTEMFLNGQPELRAQLSAVFPQAAKALAHG